MNIFENFNSCKQKFGIELTEKMHQSGIQERYLLSACRFNITNHIPIDRLVNDFKEWNSYVIKYQPTLDVNTISYETFLQLIFQAKLKHCLPNPVVITNRGVLGRLDTVKDARKVPVETTWCIKARSKFESILRQGDELYAIYLPYERSPYTFTIALIQKGDVTYFDSNNQRQFEMDEPSKNAHETFQAKIPKEIIYYLYDRAATQTESMESNNFDNISDNIIYKNNLIEKFNITNTDNTMKTNKKVIRLTESDLYLMLEEAVKEALNEIGDTFRGQYMMGSASGRAKDRGDEDTAN